MIMKNILRYSFGRVKPLKVEGIAEGNGLLVKSHTGSKDVLIQNPLQTLIGSLAACKLATLRGISRKSNLKIGEVKFTKIQSGLDLDKFMKGGPENTIQKVTIEAEIQTNVTQQELNNWIQKAQHSCPVYQMLTKAGVKVESNWKNVQTIA